jgi:uncharacterized protein
MNRTSVISTDVAEIGYDAATMTLEVAFHKGGIYQYFDVPESVYHEFMGADSKGKFLNVNFKNNYRYVKL